MSVMAQAALGRRKPDELLPRTCMRDHIRIEIVSRILDGRLQAGAHLRELALAAEFKVSQAPVREALRELEALGLLESKRYCGTRVRSIDMEELREAYELRMALEESSVRLAAGRCEPAALDELERILARLQDGWRESNVELLTLASLDFHRQLIVLSGNRLYLRAWEHMAWDVRARIAVKRIGLIGSFIKQRRALIRALREGDGEQAAAQLHQIFEALLQRLAKIRSQSAESPA